MAQDLLHSTFSGKWIGRYGPNSLVSRDYTCKIILYGAMKKKRVIATKVREIADSALLLQLNS
jgi:hypothetical protein